MVRISCVSFYPRFVRSLVVAVSFSLLSGCAAYRGYPDRAVNLETEIQQLQKYFAPDIIEQYDNTPDEKKKAFRDDIVNARIKAIDLYFDEFRQSVFRESVGLNISTDLAVITLGGVGALTSGTTVNILSAISGGITGAKGSIDKNLFFDETAPALLSQMIALRKEQLVKVRTGLTRGVNEYPLTQALVDINDYFNAGTIPGAIMGITETSGEAAAEADEKLDKILTGQYVKDEAGNILRRFWMEGGGRNLDNEAKLLEKMKGNGIDVDNVSIPFFLRTAEFGELRVKILEDLRNEGLINE